MKLNFQKSNFGLPKAEILGKPGVFIIYDKVPNNIGADATYLELMKGDNSIIVAKNIETNAKTLSFRMR